MGADGLGAGVGVGGMRVGRTENVERRGELQDAVLNIEDGLELQAQGHCEFLYRVHIGARWP